MYSETPDVFDDLTGQSATADIMNRMELFGAMPPADEEDPRPLPELDDGYATLETVFDALSALFAAATGHPWMPGHGSKVSRSGLTAAVIDSREFLAATERRKTQSLAPEGPKVVVSGGMDFTDHNLVWNALDKARAKHADMVLVHGGAPKGVDLIAAKWAEARNVAQVVFKPDWKRYGKSRAGFVRNDQMLDLLPIGVLAFPGTGITENLVDKARNLGIPAKKYG